MEPQELRAGVAALRQRNAHLQQHGVDLEQQVAQLHAHQQDLCRGLRRG
jgi:cell division protein FtsB